MFFTGQSFLGILLHKFSLLSACIHSEKTEYSKNAMRAFLSSSSDRFPVCSSSHPRRNEKTGSGFFLSRKAACFVLFCERRMPGFPSLVPPISFKFPFVAFCFISALKRATLIISASSVFCQLILQNFKP